MPKTDTKIPFFSMSVAAGIPVPVDNDIDREIDLNEFLVEHPAATFFVKVKGETLVNHGISNNDILIVDTALEPEDKKFVIAAVNDELSIRIYRVIDEEEFLESHTGQFLSLKENKLIDFKILGVITRVIHTL